MPKDNNPKITTDSVVRKLSENYSLAMKSDNLEAKLNAARPITPVSTQASSKESK